MASDTFNLGVRVKSLRLGKGFSLRQLARLAGCSPSFLSQLELNKASPTVANLQKICRALNLSMSDVLRDEPVIDEPILIGLQPEGRSLAMRWHQAMLRHLLPPHAPQLFTSLTLSLEVNGSTPERRSRRSINELAIVLSGLVRLNFNNRTHDLEPGKALYYNLAIAHSWHNIGPEQAHVLIMHPYQFELFEQEEEDLRWQRRRKTPVNHAQPQAAGS